MEKQNSQIPGLRQENKILEKYMEDRRASTLVVETVKARELELNEKLKFEQK